ncbi:hypothetical protein [Vibrio pectenicida]|uniref:Uncharacterized protein n=1 Tax=Vibrio pectenicida TaxID=62763 RepID=A0A3R9F6W9_9VIBR|nr:hypothetical protein [Vibrio pectenicida]RSD30336.1 hypothetical protein EJA03_14340 [Vibrio pectenicida]
MLLLKNNASFYHYHCKVLEVEILLLIHDSDKADFLPWLGGEPITEQEATALISKGVMLQCHANAIVPIGEAINAAHQPE